MKELSSLKKLAEGSKTERAAVDQFFNALESDVEAAYNAISVIRTRLQSKVLSDLIKKFGMPETESKAAKLDAESAWQAIRSLEEEFNDLYMAVATAAEPADE